VITAERWFGAKGRTIGSIELEDAFVLDAAASHVLAVARFGLDDGSWQRYTFVLTGRPLHVAAGVVLAGFETDRTQVVEHAVGDGALLSRRARQRRELDERREYIGSPFRPGH